MSAVSCVVCDVEVKLLKRQEEHYLLARSRPRRHKERAIRRRQRRGLARGLEKLRKRIEDGRLKDRDKVLEGLGGLKGRFPTNLDGGLLSHSHVGSPAGLHVIEVARQLWEEAEPERQVASPRLGLCHHQGMAVLGPHGTCVLARS